MKLPKLSLPDIFCNFDSEPVIMRQIPRGGWSAPIADLVMLLKLTVCAHPKRILELGSFRGYTALLLAQHSDADARIVAVDRYSEHGEAYLDTPFAKKIERRVGEIGAAMFGNEGLQIYDLVFVDADHVYGNVKKDSELVLPLVSPRGFVVWHDYANWGYFTGTNGVPEYLGELATAGIPIAHIAGTDLAVHSPAWGITGASRSVFMDAVGKFAEEELAGPWASDVIRG